LALISDFYRKFAPNRSRDTLVGDVQQTVVTPYYMCVTNWTHLFAEQDVTYEPSIIDSFISFVDYMSCSAETYTSLGGSNGCADQLTNWDGTKKLGLGAITKKKGQSY